MGFNAIASAAKTMINAIALVFKATSTVSYEQWSYLRLNKSTLALNREIHPRSGSAKINDLGKNTFKTIVL